MHPVAQIFTPVFAVQGFVKSNAHPLYRPDVDGLRAVAVLSVVISHALPGALPGGFVGVDIFFVISGYLISSIIFGTLKHSDFSFIDFYAHRIRRIFPALILVLASAHILGWFTLLPTEARQLGKHMVSSAGFVLNLVLQREAGYFDTASEFKPLMHLWSLAIEEQFYLVYPLLIWCAWKLGWNILRVIVAVAVMSFLLNIFWIEIDITQTYFSPFTRFWELLAGAILAHRQIFERAEVADGLKPRIARWFHSKNPFSFCSEQARADLLSFCGLALILASVTLIHEGRSFPGWWAVLPVFGTVLAILAGPHGWVNRKLLAHRFMVFIGLISYPLYLWHWPLLSFTRIISSEIPSLGALVSAVALSFLLAWLTYRLIERPIRSGSRSRTKTGVLCGLLAFVGCAGYSAYQWADLGLKRPTQEIAEILADNSREAFSFTPSTQRVCKEEGLQTICTEQQKDKTIFLWGDSHASSLYPGINTLQSKYPSIGVIQWTGCGSPPFIRLGNYTDAAWCDKAAQRLNQSLAAIRMIGETRPSIVVLHARWAYRHYHTSQSETIQKLKETVEAIQSASPATKILVLGPVPNWKTSLSREMFAYWRRSFPSTLPPQYMNSGLVQEIAEWDSFLGNEVPKLGVSYLSAYQVLCNAQGCLTRVGPKSSDLTAVDYGHLSPAGSIYLVDHITPSLLELLGPVAATQAIR
jgi:peptidoglycan/LPS O-acetylase OafA/YrhL